MKIEDIKVGDIVVMEHPFMLDRHVVAEVVGRTKKMITVLYWTPRGRTEEPKSRALKGIFGKIAPDQTPQEASDRLDAARQVRQDLIEAAREQYLCKLANIVSDD